MAADGSASGVRHYAPRDRFVGCRELHRARGRENSASGIPNRASTEDGIGTSLGLRRDERTRRAGEQGHWARRRAEEGTWSVGPCPDADRFRRGRKLGRDSGETGTFTSRLLAPGASVVL